MTRTKWRPIRSWRIFHPDESRWLVYCREGRYRAVAPFLDVKRDQEFDTLPEALDYARSQQPLEAP